MRVNCPRNLPINLTHLTVGYEFNQIVDNLPSSIEKIKIHNYQITLLKKIPFGCKIVDHNNKEIFI